MIKRLFACLFLLTPASLHAAAPNVLIIIADDCTYNDLPLYGGEMPRRRIWTNLPVKA